MARYRLTVATSQPDNFPVPETVAAVAQDLAEHLADYLGEDVVYDAETGVRTAGTRGLGVARPTVPESENVDDGTAPDENPPASESAEAAEEQVVIDEASE